MEKSDFGSSLRSWRRSNALTQRDLAARLGVSQQAVSAWERGLDAPSAEKMRVFRDIAARCDGFAVDRRFLANQSTIRALVDTDGARLIATSAGFRAVWKEFAQLEGVYFEDRLINELKATIGNAKIKDDILRNELKIISGVSLRHVDVDMDRLIKHRWHVLFSTRGERTVGEMVFEPVSEATPTGIDQIVRLSDLEKR